MQKWDFRNRKYTAYQIPSDWFTPMIAAMEDVVNCACCGKKVMYGECYTSRKIHSNLGLGYPVCSECYEKEWEEERNWICHSNNS